MNININNGNVNKNKCKKIIIDRLNHYNPTNIDNHNHKYTNTN